MEKASLFTFKEMQAAIDIAIYSGAMIEAGRIRRIDIMDSSEFTRRISEWAREFCQDDNKNEDYINYIDAIDTFAKQKLLEWESEIWPLKKEAWHEMEDE